jgi:hypothetical protein
VKKCKWKIKLRCEEIQVEENQVEWAGMKKIKLVGRREEIKLNQSSRIGAKKYK